MCPDGVLSPNWSKNKDKGTRNNFKWKNDKELTLFNA